MAKLMFEKVKVLWGFLINWLVALVFLKPASKFRTRFFGCM